MFEAIGAAIDEVAADPSVRAVVLHGEGKSFCSGLDLASFAASGPPGRVDVRRAATARTRTSPSASPTAGSSMPAPVIAAVHGNCIGGGAQIALGADVRIVAPDATISIREVHWGLIPDMGITRSLPRLVRFDVAKELVLTARMISGEEAVRVGLATTVAADPLARRPRARRRDRRPLARRDPPRARRCSSAPGDAGPAESLALEEELQRELLGSANQMQGRRGRDGRPPGDFDDPS